jgi:uncharacterized membrane protein YbhN (UPF0104 family)
MVAGGPVRYRLYSAWGLSALEITKIVFFCIRTLWFGFFHAQRRPGFIFRPVDIPRELHLLFGTARPVGFVLAGVVALYLVVSLRRSRPFMIRGLEFSLPSTRLFLMQLLVAAGGWIAAGSVLYALLPHNPAMVFTTYFGLFLLAQLAGLISQVPGGLGVFEALALVLFRPFFAPSALLAPCCFIGASIICCLWPLRPPRSGEGADGGAEAPEKGRPDAGRSVFVHRARPAGHGGFGRSVCRRGRGRGAWRRFGGPGSMAGAPDA